jgi:putative transposase
MMSYPTDLSDAEFRHIEHLPAANHRGPPKIHAPREILNAVFFYVLKSGCPWRLSCPATFRPGGPPSTIGSELLAHRVGTWERLNTALREALRAQGWAGTPSPVRGSSIPSR